MKTKLALVAALFAACAFSLPASAKTWHVSASSGNDSNAGTSEKPFKTIQKAVDSCADGDTILVGPGTYKEAKETRGGLFNTNARSATIQSTDGPLVTAIDGAGKRRVLKGSSDSAGDNGTWPDHCLTLKGFTLQNGYYSESVGAFCNAFLYGCIVKHNVSVRHQAVCCAGFMENCLVFGNVASNKLSSSGAMLFDNTRLVNCTVADNTVVGGTGVSLFRGCILENTIIFGNDAGGGFLLSEGSFATNSFAEAALSGANNGILHSTPFVDAAGGNYRLRADSPCVDAGANEFVATDLDLRESPRVVNGTVDAGCYEYREPVTWHVDAVNGDDSNDGLGWNTALKSIQAAVNASAIDDTILVADGVYEPFTALNRKIEIRSVNGAATTVIDGGGTNRCATLGSNTNDVVKTMLVGFTMKNGGNATEAEAHGGGAIGGILYDCIVSNNVCPTVKSKGGGLFGSMAYRCNITDNIAADDGGGADYCQLFDCIIANNRADNSGGSNLGGGIGYSRATRCTIVNNQGVYGSSSKPGGAGADSSILESCIVRGNTFTTGATSDSYNCTATYSCFGSTVSGTGNIVADPLFVDAVNGDYRLRAESPCIDNGSNSGVAWNSIDLSGMHRRIGTGTDMGCFEFTTHREPTTIYVDATIGDDANDGLSSSMPKLSIQSAIDSSIDDDIILVADGIYTRKRGGFSIFNEEGNRRITIRSINGPKKTFITGEGTRRCAKLSASFDARTNTQVATLVGFTLTNGWHNTCGGVSHGVVENCVIAGCVGKLGTEATSDESGAASRCILRNCLIRGNTSLNENGSDVAAGAIKSVLYNCTVVGNTAMNGAPAGGLYDCMAYNCIVTGNKVGGVAADVAACTLDHCCLTSLQEGEGNLVAFPKFADEAGGDYRLLGNSPCIDAGSDANAAGEADLWGNARVQGAHVDIGAYEAGPESWLRVEDAEVTYNGASNTLAVTASFPGAEATVLYGLSANGPFTSEAPAFKDAGSYSVWVVATAPGYPAVTNAVTLVVRKKEVDPSMMCVVPDQVWDGTAKTPEVHIRDGWPDILGTSNYDVEYVDNVDVGTAGVRVTGKNNYEGSLVYPFGIDEPDDTRFLVVDLSGGTNAAAYPVSYLGDVPAGGWTDEYKTTKLVLRKVREGSFWMGDPNEAGEHHVTLTRDFYVGVFEVTQKQWELVMGTNPSDVTGETHPIGKVSYNDIRGSETGAAFPAINAVDSTSFLGVLRTKTGLDGFDLPTDAQWEYACRAGTDTELNSGKNLEVSNSFSANLDEIGRFTMNRGTEGDDIDHAIVGSYIPNRFGLFDMHGNVWEWCRDWYASELSVGTNPKGPSSGSCRIRRGGSYGNAATVCVAFERNGRGQPSSEDLHTGFRLVCSEPEPEETVWHVDAEHGDDENTGRSWDEAVRTIQNAADRSVAGNTVVVTNGVYEPFTAMNLGIVIRSVEGAENTIIDGGGTNRCATLGSSTNDVVKTTLVGFTLKNGYDNIGGGVMGGFLLDSVCENNISTNEHNNFCGGGAVHAELHRCVVRNNRCKDDGGGASSCILFDCLVTGNICENTGGGGAGGGVDSSTAIRCTIVGNTAVRDTSNKGPGGADVSQSTIVGCIVWDNAYTDGTADAPFNSTATYSCFGSSVSGTGNIVADPLFVDAANGNYRLAAGSPCIDAGELTTEAKLGTDLDGQSRWTGVGTDMGCYEWATHYAAATQYVAQATGDDANDGLSWETAKATIQNAIDWAADGDEIVVADGVYAEETSNNGSILNRKNAHLRIRSVNGPESAIIDGQGVRRCVQMATRNPTEPLNSYAYETRSDYGILEGFTLRNGYSPVGGAAAVAVTLKNCILTKNTSGTTGVAYGTKLENCLVFGNANWNSNHNDVSPSAAENGTLVNCTIVANTNKTSLGACAVKNCTVTNCIIVGNVVVDSLVENEVDAATCKVGYSCLDTETAGTSNVVAAATDLFFDAAKGDYRVRAVAPSVEAGDTSQAAGSTDLAGNPRVLHAAVDMGCYEYDKPETPVITPPDGTEFGKSTQTVLLTCSDPDATIYGTTDGSTPMTNDSSRIKFSIRATTTVKAVAIVRGDWASEVASATIVRIYVAGAPGGLTAEEAAGGIVLDWNAVDGAASYRVCRGPSPDLAAATLLGSTDGTSWTDTTVEAGKSYYYFVVSENIAGVSEAGVPAIGSTLGLPTAVNMPQLVFTTGDGCPWTAEATAAAADRVHDARSGTPDDDGESWLETTVSGAGRIAFRWRVSCERDDSGERDWDHLVFLVDGDEKARIDGETGWTEASFEVAGAGPHAFRWVYVKDFAMSEGDDRGWLDCVEWRPAASLDDWETWVDFHGIGSPSGYEALKPKPSGKGGTLYDEFVAGLNPLDPLSRFLADIHIVANEPVVTWKPDLGAFRVYRIFGKRTLDQTEEWVDVTNLANPDSEGYRFFKTSVALPE